MAWHPHRYHAQRVTTRAPSCSLNVQADRPIEHRPANFVRAKDECRPVVGSSVA
jgi:hypothetical protein